MRRRLLESQPALCKAVCGRRACPAALIPSLGRACFREPGRQRTPPHPPSPGTRQSSSPALGFPKAEWAESRRPAVQGVGTEEGSQQRHSVTLFHTEPRVTVQPGVGTERHAPT